MKVVQNSQELRVFGRRILDDPLWNRGFELVFGELQTVEGQTILDLGCGLGEVSVFLALHGATIFGLDVDGNALKKAQGLAAQWGMREKCFFLVCAGESLSLGTGTVDIVFSRSTIQYMDRSRVLSECLRVLKPGGKLILLQNLPLNPFVNLYRLHRRWHSRAGAARAYVESIKGYITIKELQSIQSAFSNFKWEFHHFLHDPTMWLIQSFPEKRLFRSLDDILIKLDTLAFTRIPILRRLAWLVTVVYQGKKEKLTIFQK